VLFGTIDITQYRDDLSTFQMVPKLEGSDIPFDLDGVNVVLCDEVDLHRPQRACRAG
jgi:pyrimidine operon attenuation protein/uracil phosphoribosyltransferase